MDVSILALVERSNNFLEENPENDSLSPLPSNIRQGLIVISILACASFILTSSLFVYLNYKLFTWRRNLRSRAKRVARNIPEPPVIVDLNFKREHEDNEHAQGRPSNDAHERNLRQIHAVRNEVPNQFLVLIYNLFLADMHQSAAFLLSASWLGHNGIFIHKATCFIQGYFDSNGDLASSLFITYIAVHTYLSVIKGYQPRQRVLYITVCLIWVFVYSLSTIPVIATMNGRSVGGYFVRAGAWCWISRAYEELRLFTHYLFIFISLVATTSIYLAIYWKLRQQAKMSESKIDRHPAFLIYAVFYVLCTLPLALGRVCTMAKLHVPIGYYCFAGSLIAANGIVDCIIFSATRHSIVFGGAEAVTSKSTGLDTFSFLRTPARNFGHEVMIQGGDHAPDNQAAGIGGWWPGFGKRNSKGFKESQVRTRSVSQESLRGDDMAIHMDVVTSMTVEERRRTAQFQGLSSEGTSLKSEDLDSVTRSNRD